MKNQQKEVIEFYKDVLGTLRVTTDKDGRAHVVNPDGSQNPAVLDDKPLYLPLERTLEGDMMETVQHFHPLCEALPRKTPSPVITYMTRLARMNIGVYLKVILERLMEVAADPTLHDELPPETTDYFKKLQHVDEKVYKKLVKLINAAIKKNSLVTVYCKPGGKYQGETVTRLCTIRFPIIGMIEANDTKILKFSFSSERERKTILALFNYVLPGGYDHETYSAPSESKVAPFFDSFMLAYEKVVLQLNAIIDRHGKSMEFGLDPFPTKVFKKLDRLPEYYNNSRIPTLPGNEGGKREMEEIKKTNHAKTQAPNPNQAQSAPPWNDSAPTPPQQPQQAAPPANTSGNISMDEYRRRMGGQQPQPNNWQQPQQPQPHWQAPAYPQQMPYQQPQQPQQPHNPFSVLMPGHHPQQMGYSQYQQPQTPFEAAMNNQMGGYPQQGAGYQPQQPGAGYQQPRPQNGYNGGGDII